MKVLIVEDEILAAERLQDMIGEYDRNFEVVGPLDTVKESVLYLRRHHQEIDLIFLDIQLADGKSFEIFREVEIKNPVIFTTAYDEFAIDAFKLNSIDYLLKPISKEDLKAALDKYFLVTPSQGHGVSADFLTNLLSRKKFKDRFLVKAGQRMYFRTTSEIDHFLASDKLCYLTDLSDGRKFLIDHTLEQLEELLDPEKFFRINRSAIVQINALEEIRMGKNNRLLVRTTQCKGELLQVSRARTTEFKRWLES